MAKRNRMIRAGYPAERPGEELGDQLMAAYRRFFIEQLGNIPNIARLQSIIVLDTVKKDNRIPL